MITKRNGEKYINDIPIATGIKLRNTELYKVVVEDGNLFLPQAVLMTGSDGICKQFPYYLKISKETIKQLLNEVE